MTVRIARSSDAERISSLMTQLGYDVSPGEIAARLAGTPQRRAVFVATDEKGEVAGWASICVDEHFVDGKVGAIEGFIVDDRMRSRGIGALLLHAAEGWARDRGCAAVRVHSNVVRERAHAFYARHGYATAKTQRHLKKVL
jgi:GNAT superfamily N-acetyltransferase